MVLDQPLKSSHFVYIDKDPNLGYETQGIFYSLFSKLIAIILRIFPKRISRKAIALSPKAHRVVQRATTFEALEIMYRHPKYYNHQGAIENFWTKFWLRLQNPRAVRNRLRLVKKVLSRIILENQSTSIKIASLGSGSARAVLEVVSILQDKKIFDIFLVDKDKSALLYSERVSKELNIKSPIHYVNQKINENLSILKQVQFDIVEMVGLLDYFDDNRASELLTIIREGLKKGGHLITCNILDNPEEEFVSRVVEWEMIYRTTGNLLELADRAGFYPVSVYLEPLKIHAVTSCQKP